MLQVVDLLQCCEDIDRSVEMSQLKLAVSGTCRLHIKKCMYVFYCLYSLQSVGVGQKAKLC